MKNQDVMLHVDLFNEGETYVVFCPSLDLSSCGKTKEEALKMFEKAAVLFFEELDEMNTTEQVLSELGWIKAAKGWIPPKVIEKNLRVPLPA